MPGSLDVQLTIDLQLHWDQFVTPLPECRFPSTFAGCLLVSARAILSHSTSSPDASEGGLGYVGEEQDAEAVNW